MAAFLAKQMVGNQLSAVKDMGGSDAPTPEEKEKLEQLERERLEALREQEERRKEKHSKMEEEREKIRKGIRDKYNLKKKEGNLMGGAEDQQDLSKRESICSDSSLNRPKKSPEELTEGDPQDEFSKLKSSFEQRFADFRASLESRCVVN